MSKNALRKLSRALPAPEEIEAIMDSLRQEKDHSVAIVASSILDSALETLLRSKVDSAAPAVLEQLFGDRGVVADFYSRTVIAHAFKIITAPLAHELHAIRAIRNVFAHAKISISFDSEEIANEIMSTGLVSTLAAFRGEYKLELSNKDWFLLAVRIILIMFETLKDSPKLADEAIKDALAETGAGVNK